MKMKWSEINAVKMAETIKRLTFNLDKPQTEDLYDKCIEDSIALLLISGAEDSKQVMSNVITRACSELLPKLVRDDVSARFAIISLASLATLLCPSERETPILARARELANECRNTNRPADTDSRTE